MEPEPRKLASVLEFEFWERSVDYQSSSDTHSSAQACETYARENFISKKRGRHIFVETTGESSFRNLCARSSRCARNTHLDSRRKRGLAPNHPSQIQSRRNALPASHAAARPATKCVTDAGDHNPGNNWSAGCARAGNGITPRKIRIRPIPITKMMMVGAQ